MLSLAEIEKNYPANLRPFKRNLLREYLQYKILQIIYASPFANRLIFLGGMALRIIHGSQRFSEDIDFDNLNLKTHDFSRVAEAVAHGLELEGYKVETRSVFKGAYRCYIRFPGLLYDNKLTGHQEEKILIQLDAAPHGFRYEPHRVILNKFDVFTEILAVPADILLSQKIAAIFGRKTAKGRDFYDVVFLLAGTTPNYDYLKLKLKIATPSDLKAKLLVKCRSLDFKKLAKDVEPFLMSTADKQKVILFEEYIKNAKLS
jgi:predicted nucleotidyltransferase component of viral defense system